MTDKKWAIICDCAWCHGEGETYGNDPSKKAEECRECEGHGIEEFYEDGDEYENEEEVREDYKSKEILFVALVDRAWGSPTTNMEQIMSVYKSFPRLILGIVLSKTKEIGMINPPP